MYLVIYRIIEIDKVFYEIPKKNRFSWFNCRSPLIEQRDGPKRLFVFFYFLLICTYRFIFDLLIGFLIISLFYFNGLQQHSTRLFFLLTHVVC